MSFFLPLAMLSLSAIAAPIPSLAPRSGPDVDARVPALNFGASHNPWSLREPTRELGSSLVSSTSMTDSFSLTEAGLDTELSSTLRSLATGNSALGSHTGTWVSTNDLAGCLGADASSPFIPTTGLVVRAGEDPEAWVLTNTPEGATSSQTVADLESSSWVLLSDLVCDLTEDAFVPTQSVFVYQPDGSSNAAVYVSLTDSTLGGLSLDHTPDSFLYTDITGGSSDLGLGLSSDLDAAKPPSDLALNPHQNASSQVGSEAELLAPCDDLELDTGIATGGTSNLLTSTTSSLDSSTSLTDNPLDSSLDVDITSESEFSGSSDLGVSGCPCPGKGN